MTAEDRKKISETHALNDIVNVLERFQQPPDSRVAQLSATISVIQDYGNAASHEGKDCSSNPPRQPNTKQVASNPYDFCLVACHRLIHAFNLFVNEIAPKDMHQGLLLPDLSKFPGTKSYFSYKHSTADLRIKVSAH